MLFAAISGLLFLTVFIRRGDLGGQERGSPPVKVLVLHSYHKGFHWTDSLQEGIETVLNTASFPLEIAVEYLDAKRYPGKDLHQCMAALFTTKYADDPPDIIVSCDDDALHFLFEFRDRIFGPVPVVFCGLNVEDYDPAILDGRRGYTGVVERLDFRSTIELILELEPWVDRIGFIHDRTTAGLADRQTISELAPGFSDRAAFFFFDKGNGLSEAELLDALGRTSQNTAVFFLGFFHDKNAEHFDMDYIIPRISAASPKPVYSHAETYFGYGILGGKLLSAGMHGESTARKALEVLEAGGTDSVPVSVESSSRYMFDFRQLQRFGIRKDRLPEGGIIAYHPDSFLERYREEILWGSLGVLLLLLITVFLIFNLIRRRRAERKLALSEKEYRLLADNATDMISKHDLEGNYTFASPAVLRLLGYAPGELIGRNAFEFFHPHDIGEVRRSMNAILERKNVHTVVYRIRHKSGRYLWVETTSRTVLDPAAGAPQEILAITRDTSKRKAEETQLKASYEKINALWRISSFLDTDIESFSRYVLSSIIKITASTCGFLVPADPGQNGIYLQAFPDRTIAECPAGGDAVRMLHKEGFWGRFWEQDSFYIIERDSPQWPQQLEIDGTHPKIMRMLIVPIAGDREIEQLVAVANKESEYTEDDRTQVESFLAGIRALSDTKKTQTALKRNEAMLALSEQLAGIGSWQWDGASGTVTISRQMYRIFGLPVEQDVNIAESYERFFSSSEVKRLEETVRAAVERGTLFDIETDLRRSDGKLRQVRMLGFSEKNGDGNALSLHGCVQDITEQKESERRLKKALEEKDFLVKEINHRVKNNLAIIASLINLKSATLLDSESMTDIKMQIDAIRIVHEKLYESDSLSSIDFRAYVQELLETVFASFTEKAVAVENRIADDSFSSKTTVSLGLIINEVATNALKYAFKGENEARFFIGMQADEEEYVLTMSNNGPPLPESLDIRSEKTLGFRLILFLAEQIGAVVEVQKSPFPRFTFRFPRTAAVD